MDKPTIKNEDVDDIDFERGDEMKDANICPECGGYKNTNRKMCDSCLFADSK